MSSCAVVDRDAVTAAFDALDAAVDGVLGLDFEALTTRERLALLERCERVRRRLPAVEHPLINQLAHQATPEELGGKLSHAVAEWALISRGEAARRIREAADLGPRRTITGEPLAPVLAATAAGQREGKLGTGHVAVIRRFYHQLPGWVDHSTREQTEARLAKEGSQFRPEQLTGLADTLADYLNPDGTFTDEDRARRRGLTLGNQQADGMSQLRGWITPEVRATLEAVWAKLAAPGMCNPTDDTPCVDGTPSQETIDGDARSAPQRNHDALLAALRAVTGLRKTGSAQRVTGLHHRHHHPGRAGSRSRQRTHRRGHHPAHQRCDPPRPPRPSLLGDLRQRQCPGAVSHQTTRLTRPANHALRQATVAVLHPDARCPGITAKSTTSPTTPDAAPRTPTTSPSPAAPTIGYCDPADGSPDNAPTAKPNGSHPHTSTAANPAPTPSITPRNSFTTGTTTSVKRYSASVARMHTVT